MSRTKKSRVGKETQSKGRENRAKQTSSRTSEQSGQRSESTGSNAEQKTASSDQQSAAEGNNGRNDPVWYSRDERLIIDCASIPFSVPFGASLKMNWETSVAPSGGSVKVSYDARPQDGIVNLWTVPSYGTPSDRTSPANVAATNLYTQVRYVNNGRKNYDPADLFMYMACISDLYSYLNWLRRIYGCYMLYSQANQYLGRKLIESMGIDYVNLRDNLANFRYWVNVFTNKIASYAVPADITLFYKKAFQYANYYIEHEGETVKDQLYLYSPVGFHRFRLDEQNKGMLEFVPLYKYRSKGYPVPAGHLTVNDLMQYGDALLEFIWGDEDFGLMSGDILKAFDGKILTLGALPEDYTLMPEFNQLVLTQMENSTRCRVEIPESYKTTGEIQTGERAYYNENSTSYKYQSGHLFQDANGNLFGNWLALCALGDISEVNPGNWADNLELGLTKTLNIHQPGGDPAVVIDSIQNMLTWKSWTTSMYPVASDVNWHRVDSGSFIVVDVTITSTSMAKHIKLPASVALTNGQFALPLFHEDGLNDYRLSSSALLFVVTNLKYAPRILSLYITGSDPQWSLDGVSVIGHLDVVAQIPNTTLSNMLETSMLSLLYVPGVAKYINRTSAQ